jgi:ABC-2 type transport system ATP-binding protein
MTTMIEVQGLSKVYAKIFFALNDVALDINAGEIFALLGPNGAGKTTLISIICGIVNATQGSVKVGGFDIKKNYKEARSLIGLVPQELTRDAFETVWNTVSFSRGLFGKPKNNDHIEKVLRDLSLWEKKDNKLMELSGGMKRRVLIAKALSHEPKILFLDEPTAGVDVSLRKSMWGLVHDLRKKGVTIILTTHYIEEAEEMADRVGVINKGKILLVEQKSKLMDKLGRKELIFETQTPLNEIPENLVNFDVDLKTPNLIRYRYNSSQKNKISELLTELNKTNIQITELHSKQSSLEEIFVQLVSDS